MASQSTLAPACRPHLQQSRQLAAPRRLLEQRERRRCVRRRRPAAAAAAAAAAAGQHERALHGSGSTLRYVIA